MKSEIPASANIFAKAVLFAAIGAGFSYLFAIGSAEAGTGLVAWKGAGVWLLAVYAALLARNIDGWLIVAVMALGAAGDVLIETDQMRGAMAFAAGHVIAIGLYARNRRQNLTGSQLALALAIVPITAFLAWALPADKTDITLSVVYALFLSTMAALAWTSRFPRYRTGIGAMLFVFSDLLIFAQAGPLGESNWVGPVIWLTYFIGQLLIVVGVTQALAEEERPGAIQSGL